MTKPKTDGVLEFKTMPPANFNFGKHLEYFKEKLIAGMAIPEEYLFEVKKGLPPGPKTGPNYAQWEVYALLNEMAAGHYYDLPKGFKKPASYPGVSKLSLSSQHPTVNLAVIDPQDPSIKSYKARATVLREIVKSLLTNEYAIVLDPEWVLKEMFPDEMVKTVLQKSLVKAFDIMFAKGAVQVLVKGKKKPTGWQWEITTPNIAKAIIAAEKS